MLSHSVYYESKMKPRRGFYRDDPGKSIPAGRCFCQQIFRFPFNWFNVLPMMWPICELAEAHFESINFMRAELLYKLPYNRFHAFNRNFQFSSHLNLDCPAVRNKGIDHFSMPWRNNIDVYCTIFLNPHKPSLLWTNVYLWLAKRETWSEVSRDFLKKLSYRHSKNPWFFIFLTFSDFPCESVPLPVFSAVRIYPTGFY